MSRTTYTTIFACGALLAVACFGRNGNATTTTLVNGAPSAATLIDRFLAALAAKDPDALHRLRVTEAEYREILMPGTVPVGQPLKPPPSKELANFAWGTLDEKSAYYEQFLLSQYGGKHLRLQSSAYDKGEQRFANHTAYRQLRLTLVDEATGAEVLLGTGSIVEVAGAYKFASFIRD
jgi:hypothetical protein